MKKGAGKVLEVTKQQYWSARLATNGPTLAYGRLNTLAYGVFCQPELRFPAVI